MSIDNRVVKLQFDNKQFEENVSKSMTTLDKLEKSLEFEKGAQGFKNLQKAVEAINFDSLLAGVNNLNKRFSVVGSQVFKFWSSGIDNVVAKLKQLESATIGQMKSGGWARAMKIENAKFAVEGLKGDWEQLYKAIDYSVTGTAYGVDAAAKAASTFMASGVDYVKIVDTKNGEQLTQMHKALRAISGVAAQTNSEFDDISHIFTTVAGNGRLMADQLNQLSGRGMNAAAVLGEQLGMTEAAVREAVSKGKIDFVTFANAMDNAFGDHAKDANKTFTGSLSNMKAALSRFGAVFATPIIQKTNTFFIAVTDKLKEMKSAISDVVKNGQILEEHLESHFAKMWQNLIDLGSALVHNIDLTWFVRAADNIDRFTEKLAGVFGTMAEYAKQLGGQNGSVVKTLYNLATITKEEKDIAEMVIRGTFGNGEKRKKALEEYIKKKELDIKPDKIQAYVNAVAKFGYSFDKAGIKMGEFTEEEEALQKEQEKVQEAFKNIRDTVENVGNIFEKVRGIIGQFVGTLTSAAGGVTGIIGGVASLLKTFTGNVDRLLVVLAPAENTLAGFYNVSLTIAAIITDVKRSLEEAIKSFTDYAIKTIYAWEQSGRFEEVLNNVARVLFNLYRIVRNVATTAIRFFKAVAKAFFKVFKPEKATGLVADFTDSLAVLSDKFVLTEEAADKLSDVFVDGFEVLQGVLFKIGELINKVMDFIAGIKRGSDAAEDAEEAIEEVGEVSEKTGGIFNKIFEIGGKVKDFFKGFAEGVKELFAELKENEGVKHLKDAISGLGDAFKGGITDGFSELKDGIGEFNKEAGTNFTVKDLADAIGKFADKVAGIVEKIPGAVKKVEDFFSKVWNAIKGFFAKLRDDETYKGIKDFFTSLFDFSGNVVEDVEEGVGSIGERLTEGLNNVDWKEVLNGSFIIGATAFLIKMTNLCDAIAGVFDGVGGIIETVEAMGKGITKVISTFGSSMRKVSDSILIGTIAASIMAIVAAVLILSKIPEDDLSRATAALEVVVIIFGGVVAGILAIMAKLEANRAAHQAQLNARSFAIEVGQMAVRWIGIIGAIAALGWAIKCVTGALRDIADLITEYNSGAVAGAIVGVIVILIALVGITIALLAAAKWAVKKFNLSTRMGQKLAIVVGTFAAVMVGVALSIFLMASAMEKLSKIEGVWEAIGGISLILIALGASLAMIMLSVKGIGVKELGSIALIILELVVALGVIFVGIYLLASLITLNKLVKNDKGMDPLIKACIIVGVMLAVLAGAVSLMLLSLKNLTSNTAGRMTAVQIGGAAKIIKSMMTGIVVLIAVVMVVIGVMAGIVSDMSSEQITGLSVVLGMVVAALVMIAFIFEKLSLVLSKFTNADDFKKAAPFILSLGAMMLMIFGGIALMMLAANSSSIDGGAIAALATILVISCLGMSWIIKAFTDLMSQPGFDPDKFKQLSVALIAMSAAFLIMSVSIGIIAVVVNYLFDTFSTEKAIAFMLLIVLCAGIMAALILLAKWASKTNTIEKALKSMALAMISFAGMVLVLAIAIAVLTLVPQENLLKAAFIIGGLIVLLALIFGIFAGIAGGSSGFGDGLMKVAEAMQKIGIAFLLVGASVLVFAIGLGILGPAAKLAGEGLGAFFTVLEEHEGTAKILGITLAVIIGVIAFMLIKLAVPITNIVNAVTNAFNTIFNAIKTVGKAIWNVFKTGATKIGGAIKSFFTNSSISSGLKAGVSTMVIALVSGVTDSGPTVLKKLGDFLWMIIEWLIASIPKVVDKLVDILLSLIWSLLDAITSHVNEIEAAIVGIIEVILTVVVKVLMDATATILDFLFGWIPGDWIQDKIKGIKKSGDDLIKVTSEHVKNLRESAKERDAAIRENRKTDESAYDSLWDFAHTGITQKIKETKGEVDLAKKVEEQSNKAFKDYLSTYNTDLDKKFLAATKEENLRTEEMKGLIDAKSGFVDEFGNFYRIKAEDISILEADPGAVTQYDYTYIKKQAEAAGAEEGKVIGESKSAAIGDAIKSYFHVDDASVVPADMIQNSGFMDYFKGTSGFDNDSINEMMGKFGAENGFSFDAGVADGITNNIDIPTDAANGLGVDLGLDLGDGYAGGLVESQDNVEKAADSVVDTTADKLADEENKKKMKAAATELSEAYASEITYSKGKAMAAGSYIVEGMKIPLEQFAADNIYDSRTAAYLAYKTCQSILNAINSPEGMDMGSPSKKMRKIGNYIVQGLTNGIYDEETDAISSMSDISSGMLNAFTSPLDYVSKVASGEYEYDPSIRPVLDTSNIARGATGINSMFDHQNVTLNGLSGSIAADIGQLDNTNTDIIKELRALRNDMSDMGDKIAGMQVVMDSGRLVGAIAPDMDKALGSRATANLRGKG